MDEVLELMEQQRWNDADLLEHALVFIESTNYDGFVAFLREQARFEEESV